MNLDANTSQVKVPSAYFAKSKLEYSNWRWAFFRELIQNEYDAGCSSIAFEIVQKETGVEITAVGDGRGMTEDILVNVLLCLGGSLKQDGAVGGFGYAKSLLFFAHTSYTIHTQDNFVQGSGGNYILQKTQKFVRGTRISVFMEGEQAARFESELRAYAHFMRLERTVEITLGLERLRSSFEDFEYNVSTSIGKLLFKDVKGSSSKLVVAVSGLPMFVHQVYTSGTDAFEGMLYIEGSSFEMLTSNRDSLKGEYETALNRLVQKMIEQRFSFKLGKTIDITVNYTIPFVDGAARNHEYEVERAEETDSLEASIRFLQNDLFPRNFNIRIQNTVGRKTSDLNESTIGVSAVLSSMKKGWVQRLAVTWKLLVLEILECQIMQDSGVTYRVAHDDTGDFYLGDRRIATGFIYAKGLEGINIPTPSGFESLILCNPLIFDKDFTIPNLCDLAIHECTHLFASGHNDLFNDLEMKIRQSLRRRRDEAALTEHVKLKVKKWKATSIQY